MIRSRELTRSHIAHKWRVRVAVRVTVRVLARVNVGACHPYLEGYVYGLILGSRDLTNSHMGYIARLVLALG